MRGPRAKLGGLGSPSRERAPLQAPALTTRQPLCGRKRDLPPLRRNGTHRRNVPFLLDESPPYLPSTCVPREDPSIVPLRPSRRTPGAARRVSGPSGAPTKRSRGEGRVKEAPLATSTPRHTRSPRSHLPTRPHSRFSPEKGARSPSIQQPREGASRRQPAPRVGVRSPSRKNGSSPSRVPPATVTGRGTSSRRRARRPPQERREFLLAAPPQSLPSHSTKPPFFRASIQREDTFSDVSLVSPMPSLDVSYTAFLTPDVLTPSFLTPPPPPPPIRSAPSSLRLAWDPIYDEVDEDDGLIHHNPLYWLFATTAEEDLPELTLSSYKDDRTPSPLAFFLEEERAFNRIYEELTAAPATPELSPRVPPIQEDGFPRLPPSPQRIYQEASPPPPFFTPLRPRPRPTRAPPRRRTPPSQVKRGAVAPAVLSPIAELNGFPPSPPFHSPLPRALRGGRSGGQRGRGLRPSRAPRPPPRRGRPRRPLSSASFSDLKHARFFDIREDARFVCVVFTLIHIFAHFEQVCLSPLPSLPLPSQN